MSASLYPGVDSLHLVLDSPVDHITSRPRTDLISVRVWCSTDSETLGSLVYEGLSLYITIPNLTAGTQYWVRYAYVSVLDPSTVTLSSQLNATVLSSATTTYGYLTKPSSLVPTQADGTGGDFSICTGIFKVYSGTSEITGSPSIAYAVVPGSETGGLAVSISPTGEYTVTGLADLTGSATLSATYGGVSILQYLQVAKAPAGVDGTGAPSIRLSASGNAFIFDTTLAETSASPDIVFTASLNNISGTVAFTATAYSAAGTELGVVTLTGLTDTTATLTAANFVALGATSVYSVKVVAAIDDESDTFTVNRINNGSDALIVELSNQAHTITANSDGSVPAGNYAGSGTTIKVRKGSVYLNVDNSSPYGINTWRLSNTTAAGITAGIATLSGDTVTIGNCSGMSGDTATITYTIEVQASASTTTTLTATQSFSKSKAGVSAITIDLASEADVVPAQSDGKGYGTLPSNQIYLYSGGSLLTSGVTYSGTATKSGLTCTVNSSTGAITLTAAADSWTTDSESFTLTAVYSGTTYTTIYRVTKSKAGSSAVFADLLSESDVVSANSAGTGYTLPSGNILRLYSGGALITSGVAFSVYNGTSGVPSYTKDNLTLAINGSTGTITLSGAYWSSDTASFELRATYNSIIYSTTYKIAKSRAGQSGSSAASLQVIPSAIAVTGDRFGNIQPVTGIQVKVYYGTTDITYQDSSNYYSITVSGSDVTAQVVNNQSASPTITVSSVAVASSTVTVTATKVGYTSQTSYPGTVTYILPISKTQVGQRGSVEVNAVYGTLITLDREQDVVLVNSGGTFSLPGTNNIKLYSSGAQKTNADGVVFSGGGTKNGLIATVNSTTGAITYSGTWITDSETFTFFATYGGATYSIPYTVIKNKYGSTSPVLDLSNEQHVVLTTNADGTGYSLPGSVTATLYVGGSTATGVSYGGTATKSGLSITVNSSTGTITFSGASPTWTSDLEVFDITATTADSKTYTTQLTVAKCRTGSTFYQYATRANSAARWSNLSSGQTEASAAVLDKDATRLVCNAVSAAYPSTNFLVIGDRIILRNSTGSVVVSAYWDGFKWAHPGQIIDGNLLVTGTVATTALAAGDITAGSASTAKISLGQSATVIGTYSASLNVVKTGSASSQVCIGAENLVDAGACIWGHSGYANTTTANRGNGIVGTHYAADGTIGSYNTWHYMGILGMGAKETAVYGTVYGGTSSTVESYNGSAGYFSFNDGTSWTSQGTEKSIIRLGTKDAAVELVGTASPMLLNGSAGTAGYVLKSNGTGQTPSWVAPAYTGSLNIQYGSATADGSGNVSIAFSPAFSSASSYSVTAISTTGNYCVVAAAANNSATVQVQSRSTGSAVAGAAIRWIAVGT